MKPLSPRDLPYVLDAARGPDAVEFGHNGGPPLDDETPNVREEEGRYLVVAYCWKKAHAAAWKKVPYDIAMFRQSRADAAGVSYHDYTLEILERGRYLQKAVVTGATAGGEPTSAPRTVPIGQAAIVNRRR
jgi:hypothetical protein